MSDEQTPHEFAKSYTNEFFPPPFVELSREEIAERGKSRPYNKFCTFPLETKHEWIDFEPTKPTPSNEPQPTYTRVGETLEIKVVIPTGVILDPNR